MVKQLHFGKSRASEKVVLTSFCVKVKPVVCSQVSKFRRVVGKFFVQFHVEVLRQKLKLFQRVFKKLDLHTLKIFQLLWDFLNEEWSLMSTFTPEVMRCFRLYPYSNYYLLFNNGRLYNASWRTKSSESKIEQIQFIARNSSENPTKLILVTKLYFRGIYFLHSTNEAFTFLAKVTAGIKLVPLGTRKTRSW